MSNVVDFQFYANRWGKNLTTCPYCQKPVNRTGWTTNGYTCNADTGEHKPLQFVLVGNVLKPQ